LSASPPRPPRQLALALGQRENFDRDDFLAGPGNAVALATIERWPDWPARTMALVGPEGSGKSHLAAIWGALAGSRMIGSRTLDAAAVPQELVTGALVIEDDGERDEAALFHLLNLAREENAFVLLTARTPPASWLVALPDLASRLRALPVVTLAAPDDAMLRAVLVKLFADRQLAVGDDLIDYLANRIERSFAAAGRAVLDLDREALRQMRPVSRTLAAEIYRTRGM
jgi:chromosomal replication initiation ATPase DnaA